MERVKKAQKNPERSQREEEVRPQSGAQYGCCPCGFPGGTPGKGEGMPRLAGMPGINDILSDPEVLTSRSYSGLPECGQNLANMSKHKSKPKVMNFISKL